jgi:DNA-binding transcriptional ArsR family regulator
VTRGGANGDAERSLRHAWHAARTRAGADRRLPRSALAVFGVMADHVNFNPGHLRFGRTWPSVEFLTRKLDYSRSTVKRALGALRRLRYLEAVENERGGRNRSTVYALAGGGEATDPASKRGASAPPFNTPKGAHSRPERGAFSSRKGAHPRPPNLKREEPRLEPKTRKKFNGGLSGTRSARLGEAVQAGLVLPTAYPAIDNGPAQREREQQAKAAKRNNWIAKLIRYANNRYPERERETMVCVIFGEDTAAAQRVLDQLDQQMRGEGWDDTDERRGTS